MDATYDNDIFMTSGYPIIRTDIYMEDEIRWGRESPSVRHAKCRMLTQKRGGIPTDIGSIEDESGLFSGTPCGRDITKDEAELPSARLMQIRNSRQDGRAMMKNLVTFTLVAGG